MSRTMKDLGEIAAIALIQQRGPASTSELVLKGIGDDCAVLETNAGEVFLVTTDTLVEGIHFAASTMPPDALGWKALAAGVSDVAAMGGTAFAAFLSIGLRRDQEVAFLESFIDGFAALAERTGVVLAGGDTVESPRCTLVTVTLIGRCAPGNIVYRSGAKAGDEVWVTASLGDSAGGLFLLRDKPEAMDGRYRPLVEAHQKPLPPFAAGRALAEAGLVTAMIDLSDGIAKDLGHICEQSGVGALLEANAIPLSPELKHLAAGSNKDPLDWALFGGEDYQLLFTADPSKAGSIETITEEKSARTAIRVGTIVDGKEVLLETEKGRTALVSGGYRHFAGF